MNILQRIANSDLVQMIGGGRRRTIYVTPATKSPHPTRHGRIVWAAVAFGGDAIGGGYDEIDRIAFGGPVDQIRCKDRRRTRDGTRRTTHATGRHRTRRGRIVGAAAAFGSDVIGGVLDEIDRHRCTAAVAEAVPVQPTDRPRHPE